VGYDLHITRAANWAENEGAEITADEWLAVVRNDPELSLVPENGLYFAQWTGASKHPEPWLDWFNGNVYTKAPDSATLRKMVQIAQRLEARVQGDEGELYSGDEPLDGYTDDADARPDEGRPAWWRRLMGN
jgi:hypothetical protein